MKLASAAQTAVGTVNDIVNYRVRLPWVLHIALVLIAGPGLIWLGGAQSMFDALHAGYAGPIALILPVAKYFVDQTSLKAAHPYAHVSHKQVWLHQPVYRAWWLLLLLCMVTVAALSFTNVIA